MTTPLREGLPPVVSPRSRVLLLGSFPSELSLQSGEYYANPRNQCWRLLGAVFGFDADVAYPHRLAAADRHGVALWDVLHSCRRTGSLDVRIERRTAVGNDVAALLADHPGIERVFVNGLAAAQLYERHVAAGPAAIRLPSSSPAATMSFADKLGAWRALGAR